MAPAATPEPCCNPGCPDPLGGARTRGGGARRYRTSGGRFGVDGVLCKRCYNMYDHKRTRGTLPAQLRAAVLKARAEQSPPRKVFGQPWEGAEPLRPETLQTCEERPSREDMDTAYRSIRARGTVRASSRPSRHGGQGGVSHLGSPASARARTAAEVAAECVTAYRKAWPGLFAAARKKEGVAP